MMWNNNSPFANPLNPSGRGFGSFVKDVNASVPIPKELDWSNMSPNNGPSVPNQLPLGSSGYNGVQFNNRDIVQCPDGTRLSISRRCVIGKENCDRTYWSNRMIENPFEGMCCGEWDDREIMSFNPDSQDSPYMSRKDIEYQKMRERGDMELLKNMTPEQKKLLSQIENGQINSKTRLIQVD